MLFNRCVGGIVTLRTQTKSFVQVVHLYCTSKKDFGAFPDIPNYNRRNSSDILNALSSTITNDSTAAHYKYHDDPYLIPMSNISKRTFAMAEESGRKAARWVKEEHRQVFQHSVADPYIEAFGPKPLLKEESEVDNKYLETLISNTELKDAVIVYNLMKSKNIVCSPNTQQALLELICFYNNEDILSTELIEERWFRQGASAKERQRKTWKDGDLADQIFKQIEPKTCKSYSAIIVGMCKYFQVERAWELFQEATEKDFKLDTEAYNSILSVGNFLKESGDSRWDFCQDILKLMNQKGIAPNVGTLNAILSTISTISNFRLARQATLKLMSEFKHIKIVPSLASWYYVLIIFCRHGGPVSHVIIDILKEIENREFEIVDPKDTFFFVTAMDVCRNHLHDKLLAKQVNNLLHFGNNYNLIGDSYKESIYYRHYFALLCQTEPLDVFMKTYELLVPNIYTPEPGIMEEILKAIDINGALDLVPKMWSDMVLFDHTNRESLLNRILKIMCDNKPNSEISQSDIAKSFAYIAEEIFSKIEDQSEKKIQKLTFSGRLLGDILNLVSRGGNWEKSLVIFNKLDKNQHKIPGTPKLEALDAFVDVCIAQRNPSYAIKCVKYGVENGLNITELCKKISKNFVLSNVQKDQVQSLVVEKY